MSKHSVRQQNQQKIRCAVVDERSLGRAQTLALSFFMLLVLVLMMMLTGPAMAVNHLMESWQQDAFRAIDLQKRLDALARQKKQKADRSLRQRRAAQKKRTVTRSKSKSLAKLRKAMKRNARRNKIKKARSRRIKRKNTVELATIVREPGKIQRCLQKAGYFKGAVTGRLDDETLLAYLSFREAKNLRHRPINLYDPIIQKSLFALCPAGGNQRSDLMVASATAKKTKIPIFVTSLKNGSDGPVTTGSISRVPPASSSNSGTMARGSDEERFATDVLAATDSPANASSSASNKDRYARRNMAQLSGASSSYAVKRLAASKKTPQIRPASTRVASANSKKSSPYARRLSIADLAMAKPVNPNTCSTQTHEPALAMSRVPMSTPGGSQVPLQMARAYDDGPTITGAISASSFRKTLRRSSTSSNRLVRTVQAKQACLPKDLYDLLATTHGRKTEISVCSTDCLPAPASFSQGQKELFAEQYKINWCGSGCLGVAEPMPLRDVMNIERQARVHVCMTPQERLVPVVSKALDSTGTNISIRSLFDQLPGGFGNEDNIAVIIGNKNYGSDLKKNPAGHVNAASMKALLLEQLGYNQKNIIFVRDAKRADFVRLFGSRGDARGELQKRLKANPDAQLMIYYSGHASSSGLGMDNYLLPVDAIGGIENRTAYSLNVLYDNLRELDARSTQLFLEAGFNSNHGPMVLPPNIAERRVNIAPLVPVRGLAIFSATLGDQKTLIDAETGIGLFTRYLIGGLAGAADQRPIGNGDRIIDSVELHVHLARNVRLAARKTLGLRQNPTLSRSDNLFLSQLSRKSRR